MFSFLKHLWSELSPLQKGYIVSIALIVGFPTVTIMFPMGALMVALVGLFVVVVVGVAHATAETFFDK